jgi:hypothetical protein
MTKQTKKTDSAVKIPFCQKIRGILADPAFRKKCQKRSALGLATVFALA